MKKQKMSNKKFRAIWIPIACFLAVFAIAADIGLGIYEQALDWFFGRGELISGSSELDADYYDMKYERTTEGKKKAQAEGQRVTEAITDEGEVLLKNDGVLPLAKKEKVTPLGYRYVNPTYGGVGSGAVVVNDYFFDLEKSMSEYFSVNTDMVNAMKSAKVTYLASDGYKRDDENKGDYDGGTIYIAEYNPDEVYSASKIGDYKTAMVFLGRIGGEGGDLQTTGYADGTEHQLQLSVYEKETLRFAKENFDKVIVIINASNALELGELENDDGINAILWIGQPGSAGFKSMGKILTGEVNPSGKMVDIYAADAMSAPTMKNFGDIAYADGTTKFLEYEEGIYVGYRYYETAAALGAIDYDEAVVYPFGYGLNYDDDKVTQSLQSVSYSDGKITVKGTITNESDKYDVKEVVQIYYEPPYDENGSKIEKSVKNLVAFEKYEVKKGQSYNFTVEIDEEDMASYDYKGYYSANGAYVLEAGEYTIYLGKNSHDSWDSETIGVSETKVYADEAKNGKAVGKRSSDEIVVTNKFTDSNEYMDATSSDHATGYETDDYCVNLTRSDWNNTFPTSTNGKQMPKTASDTYKSWDSDKTLNYDKEITERFGSTAPKSNAEKTLNLSDMRGLDYDDPKWDTLLDQIDYSASDLKSLIGKAAYGTGALESIGKPATTDVDGPQGLSKVSDVNAYQAEIVLASTWNKQLAYEMGEAVGTEMLTQTRVGWYAPAMNIHRTPFSGRNYEYYSEDAYISGKMAAQTVSGAAKYGVITYIKHFAVNDQETNRQKVCTWANEQVMREIYFKPFEICVKEAETEMKYYRYDEITKSYTMQTKTIKATLGVMSSMNSIGAVAACENYALLTEVLRFEWGFIGSVISDSLNQYFGKLDTAVQAGNDLWLWYERYNLADTSSVVMQLTIRNAIHNIGYSYANSLIMQDVAPGATAAYSISPWRIVQIAGNVVIWAAVAVIVSMLVYRTLDEKKNPDKYRKAVKKEL